MTNNLKSLKHLNYIDIIKSKFNERGARDINYSLRAFARDLNISPSRLSDLFHGKGNLNKKNSLKVASNLNLSQVEKEYFPYLADSASQKTEKEKATKLVRALNFRRRYLYKALDAKISSTHMSYLDFILLAIFSCENINCDKKRLSDILSVPYKSILTHINKLISLDLIRKCKNGYQLQHNSYMKLGDQLPPEVINKYHEEFLSLAIDSLHKTPTPKRDFNTTIFSIKEEDYTSFTKRIKNLIAETAELYTNRESNEKIYAFTTQFFPLSKSIR